MTLLHVEDDPALRDVVELAFKHLGFSGEVFQAGTIAEALRILSDCRARQQPVQLVIVDMNLPDGKGLSVIRHIKSNPVWAMIPVLVLSGEANAQTVSDAYALGANCYLVKHARDRNFLEIMDALYRCWLQSAVLPQAPQGSPLRETLGRCVSYKAHVAALYAHLARVFARDADDSRFWLEIALQESNLANLCSFLIQVEDNAKISHGFAETLPKYSDAREAALRKVQEALAAHATPSMNEALMWALEIEASFDPDVVATGLGALFPNSAAGTQALRESTANCLRDLAEKVVTSDLSPQAKQAARTLAEHAVALRATPMAHS